MKFKGENEKNLDFSRFFDTVLFIPQNLELTLKFNTIKYAVHLPLKKSFTVKLFIFCLV